MPQLLTTNAVITCPHGGVGTTVPSTPVFSVSGGFVCGEGDVGTLTCPTCIGYTLKSMMLNATTLMGRRAILVSDFQQSFATLPLKIVDPNVSMDNSSVASLPPGATSAPLSPAMQDSSEPSVIAAPPTAAFSTVTMLPASMPITFTLSHAFPLKWTLTLINGTTLAYLDVTNGVPGLVVAPSGGSWASPALAVVATMTAAFMAALTPGTHYLYMTGVSQRGIPAYTRVPIVVS